MKYRVEFDASFNTEEDAVAFLNLLQSVKDKLYKGTSKVDPVYSGTKETGFKLESEGVAGDGIPVTIKCRYHECFHDENPPKPCGNYISYDLKSEVKESVKTKTGVIVTAESLITKEIA